ncbi:MAG: PAS domain S-box protein [Desulfocapsa sp.]|nr:PAS domain S-box protein [Desulfocapsa sp.]
MNFSIRRTVASELTIWLSAITTISAVIIGTICYFYAVGTVTRELTTDAQQTAEEFSQILVLPLYNFDQVAAQNAATIYQNAHHVSGIRIKAEGTGVIFNTLVPGSSSLPLITKTISKDGLLLGSMELAFSDHPLRQAKRQVIWTTTTAVLIILIIYIIALRLILRRILVTPLNTIGSRLKEIADSGFEGSLPPVLQKDLNTIVNAANRMSAEIADKTKTLIENERHYRQIYNATNDAILIYDTADGTVVDVNQTMLDMFGYSRQEALSLRAGDLSQDEPPYSHQKSGTMIAKALRKGPQVFKWHARRKDGSLFWVEVVLKKTVINDQEVILALARDISKRLQLEDELRQSQKMEAIGTLAGGIAHDFNNILTAILGYTELAQMKLEKTSPAFFNLQQVEKASKRARELVKQILTFSRKQQLEKKVLQLAPIIAESISLLRSSIPVTIKINQKLNSQARVLIDPGQMQQVVMNLCTNALHAMPGSSGTLTISLKDIFIEEHGVIGNIELEPGEYVVLGVRDDGTGMDKETMGKIFDPYYTTKTLDKGTGLGLAVVHGIVKSHQGRISVYSEPGLGTTFNVYLPVTDGQLTVESLPVESVDRLKNKRIMVVDDEEPIRDLMQQLLIHGGYRVDVFENGVAAWHALSANAEAWDLLITDLTMPGMTGKELAGKVSQLHPALPIILYTGYGDILNSCQEEGLAVSACLQKPVSMQELLTTTAQVLQKDMKEEDR